MAKNKKSRLETKRDILLTNPNQNEKFIYSDANIATKTIG